MKEHIRDYSKVTPHTQESELLDSIQHLKVWYSYINAMSGGSDIMLSLKIGNRVNREYPRNKWDCILIMLY